MKKLVLSLFVLFFVALSAIAQNKTVTGTVTSQADGLPLPGVSVKVKGTTNGVITGADGKYSINVPSNGAVLEFSSVGFSLQSKPVGSSSVVNVSLLEDQTTLGEVVVTGVYGTKQTPRSSVTNLQSVTGDKLNTVRSNNLNNALAGKVAGIQVRSQSAAALGRNTLVRLRGAGGFGTGNGALYVVDGTILPNADDINLDDVEDVSVLQGPAASALLGPQGANGAILITTKKGKASIGSGITLNLGATFENAYILPNYQNSYAGGSSADLMKYTWKSTDPAEWKALDGKYYHNYSDDGSWGPRMTGQEYIPWYAWYGGTKYSYKTTTLDPQPDNARDYYNTGVALNNTISYGTGSDKYNFKMTYGNQYTQGLLPTTSLKKNTLNLIANYDLNEHFTIGANINYVQTNLNGEINDDYSNQGSGAFSQWFHRNIDMDIMKELRGLTTPGIGAGNDIYASWNHGDPGTYSASNPKAFYGANYWYNFYTYFDQTSRVNQRNRLYGNLSLTYKVNNDLKFTGTFRKQQNTTFTENRNYSALQNSENQTGVRASYSTESTYSNRENFELVGAYTKKISDFSIDANVGMDIFSAESKSNGASTNNGLSIPDLFTIGNSLLTPNVTNNRSQDKYNAVFARANVGYKNFLFVDATIRNDWFSTLPLEKNSVLSKSVGASFVFTDIIPADFKGSWLSEGKLRASWGEIPQSLNAYAYPGFAYGVNAIKWDGNLLMQTPDRLVDPEIQGAVATSKELGLDLKFFDRRLTSSFTYWDATETGFPQAVTLNGASGFSSVLTNIGKISKKGFEIQLGGDPVRSPNFSWNVTATYANLLDNKVVEISKKYAQTRISVEGVWGSTMPYMIHEEGKQWGQIYGNGKLRNADGVPILTSTGSFIRDPNVFFGSVLPKHTGGLQNNFTIFKMFDVSANIDYQFGGKFVSLSNQWGSYSGLTARTAVTNDKGMSVRDDVSIGGGVRVDGVDQTTGLPVTYYIGAQQYYTGLYNSSTFDDYIYDLTFVKLREVSLGYRIPVNKLKIDKFVKNATFSLVARNPVLIYAKTKDFDPSEVSATAGETAQLPGTRGLGFNLRIGF